MTASQPTHRIPEQLDPKTIGLFLDVDGTLLDIAPCPEMVEVGNGLIDDLASAQAALGGALALISGRPIVELDRLFAPLRLAASGVHGAETRHRPDCDVISVGGSLGVDAWSDLCDLLRQFPGSYAENKRVSFAVHYPVPGTDIRHLEQALAGFRERLAKPDASLRLLAGRGVFELQLDGFDKGRAIERFMAAAPFRGRRPIFVADDEIDRPAFDATLALGGLAFSVGGELPALSGAFEGPAAVRAWLHELGR